MKKIWPWLLLLLLLIIFCVWTKKDSMHLSKHTHSQSLSTAPIAEEIRYIEYTIAQDSTNQYSLEGKFATTQQQEKLKEVLSKSKKALTTTHTSTNETLHGEPAVELTAALLPHFAQHYSKGKILYHNQKLTITGTADSYEAQHEMQRLLNTSTLASSDESSVIANMPIEYAIHKNQQNVHAEGIFNDVAQINQIKTHLPQNTTSNFQVQTHHVDNGSLSTVAAFLPTFFSKYTKGDIVYSKEKLIISGNVHSQTELNEVNRMLSHTSIPVNNHTIIDPDILAQEAKERARLAALAEEQKAKQAALLLAQQKAEEAKLAEKAALAEKLRLEAAQDAAALEAKRKAEAEAAQKATQDAAALEAKHKADVAAKARIEAGKAKVTQDAAALEAKRKAEAEAAEKARIEAAKAKATQDAAALEAKRKAEAEAAEKARIEAYKAEAEAKLAEEKRRAEAARLAQERKRAEAAKEAEMKIKIANLFRLENIEFNVNKSTLTAKGQNTVNKLARILKAYPSVNIEIAGHTDSDGSTEYNQKLSQSRVDMVKTKLIAQAIKSTRLVAKGYGETKPLVPNDSRANKAKNRRVEINILGE